MSNSEFKAYGSRHMQWVEDWSKEGYSSATPAHDAVRFRDHHTGWYCDNFQDSLAVGLCLEIPGIQYDAETCPGKPCGDECDHVGASTYRAAVADPWNDGAVLVDNGDTFDNIEACAYAADALAGRYAEDGRDDDAKFQAEQQIESAVEDIHRIRREYSRLLALDDAVGARLRSDKRAEVSAEIKRIRELRNNYWSAVS